MEGQGWREARLQFLRTSWGQCELLVLSSKPRARGARAGAAEGDLGSWKP